VLVESKNTSTRWRSMPLLLLLLLLLLMS